MDELIAIVCAAAASAMFIGGVIVVGFFGYLIYAFVSSIP